MAGTKVKKCRSHSLRGHPIRDEIAISGENGARPLKKLIRGDRWVSGEFRAVGAFLGIPGQSNWLLGVVSSERASVCGDPGTNPTRKQLFRSVLYQ
jgi:hypothetical protein